jgi:hypothetical protein
MATTGGTAMGSIDCQQGDALYIDCENGPRRIKARINTLFPNERTRPDLSRLEWVLRSWMAALLRNWNAGGLP